MITGRSTASNQAGPRRLVMIADLADQLGVTARGLRHYEDIGLTQSERTSRNARAYDLPTVEILKVIILLRQGDVPLAAIGEVVRQRSDPPAQALAMRQALNATLIDKKRAVARIVELIATLDIRDAVSPTTSTAPVEPPRSGRFMRSEESVAAAREGRARRLE
jgi:DNA-binding transcriptional MerR regulator